MLKVTRTVLHALRQVRQVLLAADDEDSGKQSFVTLVTLTCCEYLKAEHKVLSTKYKAPAMQAPKTLEITPKRSSSRPAPEFYPD